MRRFFANLLWALAMVRLGSIPVFLILLPLAGVPVDHVLASVPRNLAIAGVLWGLSRLLRPRAPRGAP